MYLFLTLCSLKVFFFRSKHSISSYAIGAGDAPLPIARQITFFSGHVSQFSRMEMPKQNEEEILVTMTQTTGAGL